MTCVESLLNSARVPDHIVICDNGSIDGSVEMLAAWLRARENARVFSSAAQALASRESAPAIAFIPVGENRGYAGGNNIGIRYAMAQLGADFIWILNSDTRVEPNALARMLAVAQTNAEIAIVGAKLLRFDKPRTIQALGGGRILPVVCHDTQLGSGRDADAFDDAPIELDHLVGASLLVRVDAIRRVGLIDESYFLYREETDWCIRMRRDGWHLFCAPSAIVWHKQSHSIGFKSPLHDYYAMRNMLHLIAKFFPRSLPTAFGYFACRSILPKIVRMETTRLVAVLRAFRDFLSGVTGRSALHTEQELMRNYVHPTVTLPAPELQPTPAAEAPRIAVHA